MPKEASFKQFITLFFSLYEFKNKWENVVPERKLITHLNAFLSEKLEKIGNLVEKEAISTLNLEQEQIIIYKD